MNEEWKKAKREYESSPLPPELDARVRAGIARGRRKTAFRRFARWSGGSVAACFALLVVALNTSPAFAAAAADMPVVGGLCQVLTVRSFDWEENGLVVHVEQPAIEDGGPLSEQINEEIQKRVDDHVAEMEQIWKEYREGFLATGGTEAEWNDRTMEVVVDYEIKYQSEDRLSFVLTLSQSAFNFSSTQYFYNIDLKEDRDITLEELLGEDWVERCNQSIREQIDQRVEADGFNYYFDAEKGGFTTVDEETDFYIRSDGVVVVVFPKYAIAAGAAGIQEFPID